MIENGQNKGDNSMLYPVVNNGSHGSMMVFIMVMMNHMTDQQIQRMVAMF